MKCLICNKEFKALTNTHLKKHGVTPKEYEDKFGCKTVPDGWSVGVNNPFYNCKHLEGKSRVKTKEYRDNVSKRLKGKSYQELYPNYKEVLKLRSENLKGSKNPGWKGGIHNRFYPSEFNKTLRREIRDRDNNECFLCKDSEKNLHVHHIDYDKYNNDELNLITLCCSCHIKTNFNRTYWNKRLSNGNTEPSLRGNLLEGAETIRCSLTYNDEGNNSGKSAQHPNRMMI